MTKHIILFFLSLFICLNIPEAYGSYPAAAGAGAGASQARDASAVQPAQALLKPKLLPAHITTLRIQSENAENERRKFKEQYLVAVEKHVKEGGPEDITTLTAEFKRISAPREEYLAAVGKYLKEGGDVDAVNGVPDLDYITTLNDFYARKQAIRDKSNQNELDEDEFEAIAAREKEFLNAWDPYLNRQKFVRCSRETLLHSAARAGDEEVITMLLAHNATVDARCMNGKTPLLYAMYSQSPDQQDAKIAIVKMLMDAGADTSVITPNMQTFRDSCNFDEQRLIQVTYYLIAHRNQIKNAFEQAFVPMPHMKLVEKTIIDDFLLGSFMRNKEDDTFDTLKWAIVASMKTPAKVSMPPLHDILNNYPLDLFAKKDETGHTLLSLAQYVQSTHIFDMITGIIQREKAFKELDTRMAKEELAKKQETQKEALKQAALAGDAQVISSIDTQLIDTPYDNNKTALILATEKGHEKAVDALLAKKANMAHLDDNFKSALWYATHYGHKNVVERMLKEIPLQAVPASMLREITQAHELAAAKEKEVAAHEELYKQIKKLLAPYLANAQASAAK